MEVSTIIPDPMENCAEVATATYTTLQQTNRMSRDLSNPFLKFDV